MRATVVPTPSSMKLTWGLGIHNYKTSASHFNQSRVARKRGEGRDVVSEGMQLVSPPHCSGLRPRKDWHHTWRAHSASALHLRVREGVWLGAWSHLWHCFSGLPVPLGSRYVATIRDMPVAGDVATHADSSSTRRRSHGLCCIIVYLCGDRLGLWSSASALLCSQSRTLCQGELRNSFTFFRAAAERL